MQSRPSPGPRTVCPSAVLSTGKMPGMGKVAEPGLVGVAGAMGLITMPPVSVCQKVSTMLQPPWPTTR